jgi:hypothetical protein
VSSLATVYWFVPVYQQIPVKTNSWFVQFEKLLVQLEYYILQCRCKIILIYWIILLVWFWLHFHLLTLCSSLERKWRCM